MVTWPTSGMRIFPAAVNGDYEVIIYEGATPRFKFRDDGNAYADVDWLTFSPEIPDNIEDVIVELTTEINKGKAPRNVNGNLVCLYCGELFPCPHGDHNKEFERLYSKSAAKTSLLAGKLVLDLLERVKTLERALNELEKIVKEVKTIE